MGHDTIIIHIQLKSNIYFKAMKRILSILFATTMQGISERYSLSSLYHLKRFL